MRTRRFSQGFDGRSQSRYLRRIAAGTPLPPVTQETVAKIVGDVGIYVGSHSQDQVPRHLRPVCQRSGHAEFVAVEKAANINLIVGGAPQVVIPIAGHKVPISAEVVVQAHHPKVVVLRKPQISLEVEGVDVVAEWSIGGRTNSSRGAGRHMGVPQLLNVGVDTDAAGVKSV